MIPLPDWVDLPRRKSPRHPLHDYRQGGMYHITINVEHGIPLLGKLDRETVALNGLGRMVLLELKSLPQAYSGLDIDCFEIMPDHVHILFLLNGLDAERPDLRRVIQRFKSLTGLRYVRWRNARDLQHLPEKLWKRSFRDTYIKSERQLHAVREYILNNARKLALEQSEKLAK